MREDVLIYRLLFKTRQLVRVFRQTVSDPIKISARGGRDIPVEQLFDPRFAKRLEGPCKAQESVSHEFVSRGEARKVRCNIATVCGGKSLRRRIATSPSFSVVPEICPDLSLHSGPSLASITLVGVFSAQIRAT